MQSARRDHGCGRIPRRTFLADVGMGFTGLVLGSMLHRDGIARAQDAPPGRRPTAGPTSRPRRKASSGYS